MPLKLYKRFTELEYLLLGLISTVPSFLIAMILVGKADNTMHWKDRSWVKAQKWEAMIDDMAKAASEYQTQ